MITSVYKWEETLRGVNRIYTRQNAAYKLAWEKAKISTQLILFYTVH